MKFWVIACLFGAFACRESERPRFVVKSISLSEKDRVEWYNYSNISNYGIDRIDYVDSLGNRELIFKSHYVSDVSYDSGIIEINWWKRESIDALKEINGYGINIDSGGCSFMSSDSRRLHGEDWRENICSKNLKVIEFERDHPDQYKASE